jgi:hypothetical protein
VSALPATSVFDSLPPQAGERYVEVTDHALARFRQRCREPKRSDTALRKLMAQEVADAWNAERKLDAKPRWALLFGQAAKPLARPFRFVHTEDCQRGYIVKPDGPVLIVVTTLCRVADENASYRLR